MSFNLSDPAVIDISAKIFKAVSNAGFALKNVSNEIINGKSRWAYIVEAPVHCMSPCMMIAPEYSQTSGNLRVTVYRRYKDADRNPVMLTKRMIDTNRLNEEIEKLLKACMNDATV